MKIFIAGARSIDCVDSYVQKKLNSIIEKKFDVLIGDCYGVDSAVQNYFADYAYPNVVVYASNGTARNNKGNWTIKSVKAKAGLTAREFYGQKDLAMAEDADCGFMIWDGQSRGTFNNIVSLARKGKLVLVYFQASKRAIAIESLDEMGKLLIDSSAAIRVAYRNINKNIVS